MEEIPQDDDDLLAITSSPEGSGEGPTTEGGDAGAGPAPVADQVLGRDYSGMSLDSAEDSQIVRRDEPPSLLPSASSELPSATSSVELPSASPVLPSATSVDLPSASAELPSATSSVEPPPASNDSDDEVQVLGAMSALEALSIEELQERLRSTSEQLRKHRHLARVY